MKNFAINWRLLLCCSLLLLGFQLHAADDREQITQTLQDYIQGTSYNQPQQIERAFTKSANLWLSKKEQPLWQVPIAEYRSWFEAKTKGKFNGRVGEVMDISYENDVAMAKVEILIPRGDVRFVDYFLLKKISGSWKIISKTAGKATSKRNGKRILFIVSSAAFHGDSNLPAGVSFSELVNAHQAFSEAGYTLDYVSPDGGAIPLSYINTSIPEHRSYVYNSDFMYAIGNTKSPEQIDAKDYRAVHYIGGSNAMYGVADNEELQRISMEIYEKHNGVVSAVCHGTAGIVFLKEANGQYLVAGKRISGYPEAFENQSKAYFKQFPFLIRQTVEKHGGQFFHSPSNTAHVEVDGRVVTGQNHLSSAAVAKQVIKVLEKIDGQLLGAVL